MKINESKIAFIYFHKLAFICSELASGLRFPLGLARIRPAAGSAYSTGSRWLIVRPSRLCGLQMIKGAGRRLLGWQSNGSGIVKRPLGAGMKFGPARRHDGAHRRDAHRRT